MIPSQQPNRPVKYFLAVINSLALILVFYIIKDYEENGKAITEETGNNTVVLKENIPAVQDTVVDKTETDPAKNQPNSNQNTGSSINQNTNKSKNKNKNKNLNTNKNANTNQNGNTNKNSNTNSSQATLTPATASTNVPDRKTKAS